VAVQQPSETLTMSQQEIMNTQSEVTIACNNVGRTPLPEQSEQSEDYKLPFSDVIFYSDSTRIVSRKLKKKKKRE
jgi:hypothetical protein